MELHQKKWMAYFCDLYNQRESITLYLLGGHQITAFLDFSTPDSEEDDRPLTTEEIEDVVREGKIDLLIEHEDGSTILFSTHISQVVAYSSKFK